jgi:hypothetical protein
MAIKSQQRLIHIYIYDNKVVVLVLMINSIWIAQISDWLGSQADKLHLDCPKKWAWRRVVVGTAKDMLFIEAAKFVPLGPWQVWFWCRELSTC